MGAGEYILYKTKIYKFHHF